MISWGAVPSNFMATPIGKTLMAVVPPKAAVNTAVKTEAREPESFLCLKRGVVSLDLDVTLMPPPQPSHGPAPVPSTSTTSTDHTSADQKRLDTNKRLNDFNYAMTKAPSDIVDVWKI